MSRYYDKDKLKEQLEIEQIYDLLELWGGEPTYSHDGLICQTICHNPPGEGSRKLYYYPNTRLFSCFTSCGTMDIFELCIKVMKIQRHEDWELYDAMDYIASYFGLNGVEETREEKAKELEDWGVFKKHSLRPAAKRATIQLKEYNPVILTRFLYPRIKSWEDEGISDAVIKHNMIGYYPGGEQITIPHFDIDNRLVGIRGRTLAQDEADRFGKYRPLKVNRKLYNHPLSMNLYNLNNSKDNIAKMKAAVLFEGEKSCLLYTTYYGKENDISVACCGSSLSSYQVDLLRSLGAKELIIAFDRDFTEIGDEKFQRLKRKLIHIKNRYGTSLRITCIFDKHMLLPLHSSPIDQGKQVFEQLLAERFVPQR